MPQKTIEIQFPAAGVVRRFGLRPGADSRAPHPTPWSMNVRLEDGLTNRLRGGSFTGLSDAGPALSQAYVATEDGLLVLATEDGIPLVWQETGVLRYIYLTTEDGDNVVTENGDPIVLGPQSAVVTGDEDRVWVAAGDDAPSDGLADCLYRDRLLRTDDNIILASRQGNYTDWDFSAELEDTGRATAFQLSEGGEIGPDVLAMVPHKDSFLLCFSTGETWVLAGDPATGSLRNVSREVGIVAPRAWCKAHDTVYFLSSRGLYSVQADGSGLQSLSENAIPEHLIGVTDDTCAMRYNHADRGVYIILDETIASNWFYDTERKGFWPYTLLSTDSHVLLGPFRLGERNGYGRMIHLHGNIASSSDDVTWRVVSGETAEEAAANGKAAIDAALAGTSYSSYVAASGIWPAGRGHMAYPRVRAMWCCIWLSSTGDWAYEHASMTATSGRGWR